MSVSTIILCYNVEAVDVNEGIYVFTMLMQSTQNITLFAYNFLNNGPILSLLALLELSLSPLSFCVIMSKQSMQMKDYVFLQCIYNVNAVAVKCYNVQRNIRLDVK